MLLDVDIGKRVETVVLLLNGDQADTREGRKHKAFSPQPERPRRERKTR